MSDEEILERLKQHLEKVQETYDNDWIVIALQGSQNYGISDSESDIDSKCLVLPTFDQLVFNKKPVSHTLVMDNNEQCDVKDVREYFSIVRKSNINFVEIFFTKWFIVNPLYEDLWMHLVENNEKIARVNPHAAVRAMWGMAKQKFHALTHEYPSRKHIIEEFQYDPKQLSHLVRIRYFLNQYMLGTPYKDCIFLKNSLIRELIYSIKRQGWPEWQELANEVLKTIEQMTDKALEEYENKNDPEVEKLLDDTLRTAMKRVLHKEVCNEFVCSRRLACLANKCEKLPDAN